MSRSTRARNWVAIAALFAALPSIISMPLPKAADAVPASSTLSVAVNPLTSGTAPFDSPAACLVGAQVGSADVIPTSANSTGTSHCPGMDHSGDPTVDRIVRTLDTIDVQLGWSLTNVPATTGYSQGGVNGDTNVVVSATLPLGPTGAALGTWSAVPAGCYTTTSGTPTITPLSSISNASRTLTCNLGHRIEGTTGQLLASIVLTQNAADGTPLDIVATIRSDSTRAAGLPDVASAAQRFWFSATPKWNLRSITNIGVSNIVFGPSSELGKIAYVYFGPATMKGSEPFPTSSWAGGNSVPVGTPVSFDVDLTDMGAVAATDGSPGSLASRARLFTWNPSLTAGCVNYQGSATIRCTQSAPGQSIRVEAYGMNQASNPSTLNSGERVPWSVRIAVWFPNAAIPLTSTTIRARADNFDPTTVSGPNFVTGRSNFGGVGETCTRVASNGTNPANCELGLIASTASNTVTTANDNDAWGSIVRSVGNSNQAASNLQDKDVRAGSNGGTLVGEGSPGTLPFSYGHGNSDGNTLAMPGTTYLASTSIGNTGGLINTNAAMCTKWDNRTQKLIAFGDANVPMAALQGNAAYAANRWSVVNTSGVAGNIWRPGPKWNRTAPFTTTTPHNIEADPNYYVVEFGVGEYLPYTPPPTSPAHLAMRNTACRDADSPAGWFTDPTAAGIQTWINTTYGLGSGITPLDVVNKVRVRLLDGLSPEQYVDLAVRLYVRPTWGPTAGVGVAGNTIPFGTRLAVNAAHTDSILSTRSGTTYVNGWLIGNYDPNTDGGSFGDRLTLGGVDIRTATSTLWPSPTGANGTTTVIAGQDVWWKVDDLIFSLSSGVPVAPFAAMPARVINVVPSSLTYVPGTGCLGATTYAPTSCATRINPSAVIANSDGTTTLVWDLGLVVPTVAGVTKTIEFKTTTDSLTNTGTTAIMQSYGESMNANGSSNNSTPLCTSGAARTNRAIPASANGPAETLAIPTVECDTGSYNYRLSDRSVVINNAASMAVSGRAAVQQIEVGEDDDGTGTRVAYSMTMKNFDSTAIPSTDTIVVLPWNGDGRTPASSFSGTMQLQGVATTDTLSVTPNVLPPGSGSAPTRTGTTFYFSAAVPTSIKEDADHASNKASNGTKWCLQTEFGTRAQCPTSFADVTAVRVISGSLAASGASRSFTLRLNTDGDAGGDIFTFKAYTRSPKFVLIAPTVDASMIVVMSTVGEMLWEDTNGNGVVDGNEPGRFSGVRVELLSATGSVLQSKTTDALGTYSFSGLSAGTYSVRVVQSNGTDGMTDRYPSYSLSFDADNTTVGGTDGNPDGRAQFTLGRGQTRSDIDFGYFTATISGRAFKDTNRNGVKDLDEDVLAGATVTLLGLTDTGLTVARSAQTAVDGTYSILGLRPGTYSLQGSSGSARVTAIVGSSGGTATAGIVTAIVLTAGANASGYSFGVQSGALVGQVFVDANGNGTFDNNETALNDLTVSLTSPNPLGSGSPVTTTSLTDGFGAFRI